ncbi:Succinate-acetate/proton symporter SatP [Pontiella desulfatans]|uniref:Succinate-acetate/proton symporter SatP n=1 Tax=Pontiella desulfatans TaxID=2750659 RepID=A0A6C2UCG8_PONDE|nr:GPR1/FUN34/YaaH family transporter [Pontiella desulfatans]VGO16926.1 Succinate-acetate/proton symporter SatP [Pontiella desulfatans]
MTQKDPLANPAPLGLMGFGMTTVLLNIHNAGFFPDVGSMILGMGIFFGGIAQMIAGILEYKKGNTFGMTAFTSYGAFWLTLVAMMVMPKLGLATAPPAGFVGCYLFMWGLFTALMFVGTLKANKALQFIFASLTVLFFLLALEHWLPEHTAHTVGIVAGFEGIVCGASAIYLAMAEIINEAHGTVVLPIGEYQPRASRNPAAETMPGLSGSPAA